MDKDRYEKKEFSSTTFRHFGNNAILYGAGNALMRGVSLLLVPIYAHNLSVIAYGTLETALVTIQLLVIFMGVGIPSAVIRFYAEDEKQSDIGRLLGSSFGIIGIAMLLCSLLILLLPSSIFSKIIEAQIFSTLKILIVIASLAECLTNNAMSILRAQDKAGKYTLMAFYNALLLVLFTLLLLPALNQGIGGAIIARGLAYGFIGLITIHLFSRFKSFRFSIEKAREVFRFGFPLTFSAAGWFVLLASDRYFLAYFSGMQQVGIYSIGYKLTFLLLVLVVMPFELSYGPFVFKNMDYIKVKEMMSRLLTYLILSLIVVGYLIALFSRDIINLIAPKEYEEAYLVTICILPATALQGIHYWSNAQLHITKKTSHIAIVVVAAAFLNLVLNYLLIPKYAWVGAAVATNISYFLLVGTLVAIGFSVLPVPLEIRRLLIVLAMGVGAALSFCYLITHAFSYRYFYLANSGVLFAMPIFLYYMRFFDANEKQFLINLFQFKGRR